MPKHDSIFKGLLRSFLADLLRLTVPDLAGRFDLARPALRDKEFFTVGGRRREVDLLAEVSLLEDSHRCLLIHVEVEARARPEMDRRLWLYRHQIQAVYDRHVLSIVVYLQRGPRGIEQRSLGEDLLGPRLVDFRYVAFGLAGCDPAEYLARAEPLAWGLAALMRGGALTRPVLKLACLRRILRADLDEKRRMLLVDCVERYLELNPAEVTEYSALCTVPKNREVRKMEMTWSERMKAEGREEGLQKGLQKGLQQGEKKGLQALREVLLSQLEQRFGPLPQETRERVEAISSLERLSRLGRRVLTARSLASLRLG